ncbi:MAG: sigma-70 family RNA polymerase sigma factor, partial [Nocardioides sp.]|nr:sigma-70 family RNA polymerase sigma factor [Nocardioides sp.]
MTTNATLHQELPRDVRRRRTSRLLEKAAHAGPEERERLVEDVILTNAEVARSIARRYARRGIPLEDLEQVGYLALCRAAQRFDGERADDFLTYAVPTIRGEIKRWFRDRGWTVRPPRGVQELQTAILKARA